MAVSVTVEVKPASAGRADVGKGREGGRVFECSRLRGSSGKRTEKGQTGLMLGDRGRLT
jgi:hypothetical protein